RLSLGRRRGHRVAFRDRLRGVLPVAAEGRLRHTEACCYTAYVTTARVDGAWVRVRADGAGGTALHVVSLTSSRDTRHARIGSEFQNRCPKALSSVHTVWGGCGRADVPRAIAGREAVTPMCPPHVPVPIRPGGVAARVRA